MLSLAGREVIALPLGTVRSLTGAAGTGPSAGAAVHVLRTAGHAGGDELARAFEEWVRERDGTPAGELPLETFNDRAAEFFELAGWGRLRMSSLHDLAAAVDVDECWEARATGTAEGPVCHLTTGALAAFFSRHAPYQLATLEVECSGAGASRCRFLLGPPAVLEALYSRLADGTDYATALAQLSEAGIPA